MEADVFEVLLCHAEDIAGVGKEDIATFYIFCHVLVFALLEVFEFFWIIALYPTCFVQVYWFPATFGIVFVLKTVLDDFELKLTNGTDDATVVELVDEHLCHTFVHELLDTFLELL